MKKKALDLIKKHKGKIAVAIGTALAGLGGGLSFPEVVRAAIAAMGF
jgi:hypothetical protein